MFSYYQTTTEYSCGVDLHSRQMYICVMDKNGEVQVHRNVRGNDFDYFLKLVEPYKDSLTVCCECTFNWYWFADDCLDAGFEFIYFDGSEGVNPPFWHHVANAQYRVFSKLSPEPILAEGAAKTHFSWHMLTGSSLTRSIL